MKKLLLLMVVFFIFGGMAMADMKDHPRWSRINTFTDSIVRTISDGQDAFYIKHKRYFQGLAIVGEGQKPDGNSEKAIRAFVRPNDFDFSWSQFDRTTFRGSFQVPFDFRVNVYQSSDGWGWIWKGEMWIDGLGPDAYGNDGDHWVYYYHEGPEDLSGSILNEWHIEPEDPEIP